MRRIVPLLFGVVACAALAGEARAADVNVNTYMAYRQLDKDFWDPVDGQVALGGTVDFGPNGSPAHFAFGLNTSVGYQDYSGGPLNDLEASVTEWSFGVAKVWETKSRMRPFLSGGASFVKAQITLDTVLGDVDDDDDSLGLWVEGGIYWRVGPHFNAGFHVRALGGTSITLFSVDGDADYVQIGPMLGWSWPPQ